MLQSLTRIPIPQVALCSAARETLILSEREEEEATQKKKNTERRTLKRKADES